MYFKIFFRFVLINIFLSLVFQDGKDYKVQIIDGKWKLDLNYTMNDMKCWNFSSIWALSEHWRWSNQGRVIKPPNNQSCFPQFFHEFFSVEQLEMNTNYSLVQNKKPVEEIVENKFGCLMSQTRYQKVFSIWDGPVLKQMNQITVPQLFTSYRKVVGQYFGPAEQASNRLVTP